MFRRVAATTPAAPLPERQNERYPTRASQFDGRVMIAAETITGKNGTRRRRC
jgi:hypothetical protein